MSPNHQVLLAAVHLRALLPVALQATAHRTVPIPQAFQVLACLGLTCHHVLQAVNVPVMNQAIVPACQALVPPVILQVHLQALYLLQFLVKAVPQAHKANVYVASVAV